MQENGIHADQVSEVRGYADQKLRKVNNPSDASNRRISVTVKYLEVPPIPEKKPDAAAEKPGAKPGEKGSEKPHPMPAAAAQEAKKK
jgi:chemotaxis protein MotB